jgi:dimeric dUTPase (all-alpha-NTP-PPase superfamily)
MNYKIFNEVYESNKELDQRFDDLFTDPDMYKKNQLELLVEIGELANETRYFKYWSNKPIDINLVKGEYADCIIMTLYFFNKMNISLEEEFNEVDDYDKIEIFARLYKLASDFYYNNNKDVIKEIFVTLIKLGYLIGFNNDDIIEASLTKINKNKSYY